MVLPVYEWGVLLLGIFRENRIIIPPPFGRFEFEYFPGIESDFGQKPAQILPKKDVLAWTQNYLIERVIALYTNS